MYFVPPNFIAYLTCKYLTNKSSQLFSNFEKNHKITSDVNNLISVDTVCTFYIIYIVMLFLKIINMFL